MSAAAGISAAKKRRGVVSTAQEQQETRSGASQNQQGGIVTPIQILQNHEVRLKIIEKNLNDADEYAKQMSRLEQKPKVEEQVKTPQINVVDMNTFNIYKERCETLEKKVEELSMLLQKVQTFSMESNTMILKMKNKYEDDITSRIQNLKQNYISTDENVADKEEQVLEENVKKSEAETETETEMEME